MIRARPPCRQSLRIVRMLAWVLAVSGCASAPALTFEEPLGRHETFPYAARLLDGFDVPESDTGWRHGDRILLGIEAERGQTKEVWYVRLTLEARPSGRHRPALFKGTVTADDGETIDLGIAYRELPVLMEVFDEDGAPSNTMLASIPDMSFDTGLYDSARRRFAPQARHDDPDLAAAARHEEMERQLRGMMTILLLPAALISDDALSSMVWHVVDRPDLLNILLSGKPQLSLAWHDVPERVDFEITPERQTLRGYRIPIKVSSYGREMMRCWFIAVPPRSALGMTGGVVQVRGVNPRHPNHTLRIELLAAQRGVDAVN